MMESMVLSRNNGRVRIAKRWQEDDDIPRNDERGVFVYDCLPRTSNNYCA